MSRKKPASAPESDPPPPAEYVDPRSLAIRLAYEQCHPDAIAVALHRRLRIPRSEAVTLCGEIAEDLADAKIDGQTAICSKIWAVAFGQADGKGVTTLTALAHQYCGWSQSGVSEAVQKAMIAATKGQFGKLRAVG